MMLNIKEALAMGLAEFKDERRFCSECQHYSFKPYRGKCAAQLVQYAALNRCGNFTEKNSVKNNTWTEGQKPFWE